VTLLELVIVIALLSLLAGLVAPSIGHSIDEWRLRSAAERIAQTIRYARIRALYEQRYYLVEIRPGENQVSVREPVSGVAREYALPPDVQVGEGENPASSSVLRLIIPPSGALEEKTLWVRNRRGSEWRIHLDFLLGTPEVQVARQGA
jgi:Tfp pilus assembly protein FimT